MYGSVVFYIFLLLTEHQLLVNCLTLSFGPRSGQSELFDILIMFPEEFFENFFF